MTPVLDPAVPVASIVPPAHNPNVMREDDFARLRTNIQREGFLQPILVRRVPGGDPPLWDVIDGAHRLRAAVEIGLRDVPCVVLPADYPDDKARLLQIGMNRLRGQLDLTEVAGVLAELDGADLALSGFSDSEIAGLLAAIAPPDLSQIGADVGDVLVDDDSDRAPKFDLVLPFDSAADLKAAKRALKKAAGKGGTLTRGLKAALGLD